MTTVEISMEDSKLDSMIFDFLKSVSEEHINSCCENNSIDWWIEEYPTLESAEAELLERHRQLNSLDRDDFNNSIDYISECAKIDREIMMLEMTIDELYTDWSPDGAKHEEFEIGTIFRSGNGRFLCTDVGTRTIVAIRYTPRNPDDMKGPPYFLVETVFDEIDIKGVTILNTPTREEK